MHILQIRSKSPLKGTSFVKQNRKESETADQFVLRLFQLSENCEFREAREEHVRDQLNNRQMQVTQPSPEIAGSKRNTCTPKGARECKINGTAESQTISIENDSKSDRVHALEDKQDDYDKGTRGNCYRCGL